MTQRDEFDSARPGDRVSLSDLKGQLVLFSPIEYLPLVKDADGKVIDGGVMTTDYGRKDVVITDMVVLDGDGSHTEYVDVMIFNGKPIGDLKRRIGRKYLAVVGLSAEKIKGNYAVELHEPTEAHKQLARDFLAGRSVAAASVPPSKDDDPFAV